MSRLRYLTAMLIVLLTGNMAKAQEPVSVFIYAGQSNTDGRAYETELPEYMKDGYENLHFVNVTWSTESKFGERKFGDPKKRFAFCDVTNYFIDKALNTDFYAVKCAYGGTSIDTAATVKTKPVWCCDSAWLAENEPFRGKGTGMSLSKGLIAGLSDCIDSTLSKIDKGYDVKAIMWHQGESDRKKASHYYDNFKTMINYMRNAIYEKTCDEKDKTLPFIFGTIARNSRQYSAGVEAAQMKVAKELPNVYYVDMSKGQLGKDILHFNGAGTEDLGKKMYNKLVELKLVKGNKVE